MLEQRQRTFALCLLFQLGGAFERWKIVGRNSQRAVVGHKGIVPTSESGESNSLQSPQPGVLRRLLHCGLRQLKRVLIIVLTQGGFDGRSRRGWSRILGRD